MFGAIFFQVPAYKDVFAFFIIIVIMIIKPTGIIQESAVKRV
jgi:branched-subunit amino acid ABC-type transport system permease component